MDYLKAKNGTSVVICMRGTNKRVFGVMTLSDYGKVDAITEAEGNIMSVIRKGIVSIALFSDDSENKGSVNGPLSDMKILIPDIKEDFEKDVFTHVRLPLIDFDTTFIPTLGKIHDLFINKETDR